MSSHICLICNKKFRDSWVLKRHQQNSKICNPVPQIDDSTWAQFDAQSRIVRLGQELYGDEVSAVADSNMVIFPYIKGRDII